MQNETNQAYKLRSLVLYRVGKRAIFVFSRVRFERFSDTPLRILAFHASVFRGARISSLPTNGRNTSSPKNACVGGYTDTHSIQTPVYDGQFRLSRRKDYLFCLKLARFIRTGLIRIWIMMTHCIADYQGSVKERLWERKADQIAENPCNAKILDLM